jgi:hypothetical protein
MVSPIAVVAEMSVQPTSEKRGLPHSFWSSARAAEANTVADNARHTTSCRKAIAIPHCWRHTVIGATKRIRRR